MFEPGSYGIALLVMVISMVCWGSWANTLKATVNWPFSLAYWDFVIGVIAVALILGFTFGSTDGGPASFTHNLLQADATVLGYALLGGIVFNIANLLLVAAINIAGLAVAFPIGIGLALVIGVISSYVQARQGSPLLLFGGVALVVAAIVLDAIAYRMRNAEQPRTTARGIQLALLCGVLMGGFFPLVTRAQGGPHGLGPYTVAFVFSLGVMLCTIPVNLRLMRHPMTGERAASWAEYRAGRMANHAWGVAGGMIWGLGGVAAFLGAHGTLVGPAISYAMGQGSTMISAAWGVFIWREFAGAPLTARRLLIPVFLLFIAGLWSIAVAPLYG